MSMCRVFSCVVGRGYLLWSEHSLGITVLAFALLHITLQYQICLLLQVSLDFLLLHWSEVKWSRSVMYDSLRPHGLQPTELLCPWDFPGKNTAISFSRGTSQPRDRTQVSRIVGRRFTIWATLEGLVGLHRAIQLQLLQHHWLGHRLRLLWYWMVCLGNEQRSFSRFWGCIQVMHFRLFCWLW